MSKSAFYFIAAIDQDHQVAISDPLFSRRAPIATLVHPFVRRVRLADDRGSGRLTSIGSLSANGGPSNLRSCSAQTRLWSFLRNREFDASRALPAVLGRNRMTTMLLRRDTARTKGTIPTLGWLSNGASTAPDSRRNRSAITTRFEIPNVVPIQRPTKNSAADDLCRKKDVSTRFRQRTFCAGTDPPLPYWSKHQTTFLSRPNNLIDAKDHCRTKDVPSDHRPRNISSVACPDERQPSPRTDD